MSMSTLRYVYVNLMLCQSTLIYVNRPYIMFIDLTLCRSTLCYVNRPNVMSIDLTLCRSTLRYVDRPCAIVWSIVTYQEHPPSLCSSKLDKCNNLMDSDCDNKVYSCNHYLSYRYSGAVRTSHEIQPIKEWRTSPSQIRQKETSILLV